ncbi:hypothetical protein HOP50_07g49440 [Chloropicon primus]|nr:hypothetical protein HOP50_07g49440 [Chloropicon primus]
MLAWMGGVKRRIQKRKKKSDKEKYKQYPKAMPPRSTEDASKSAPKESVEKRQRCAAAIANQSLDCVFLVGLIEEEEEEGKKSGDQVIAERGAEE